MYFPIVDVNRLEHFKRCGKITLLRFFCRRVVDVVYHGFVFCLGMTGRENAEHSGCVTVVELKRILVRLDVNGLLSLARCECHRGAFVPRLIEVVQDDAGLLSGRGSQWSAELNPDFVVTTIRVNDDIVRPCINDVDAGVVRVRRTTREGDDVPRLCLHRH